MDITREERTELNTLSKEVFGVSSKWQKMFKGQRELITKKIKEIVPGDKGAPDTEREVEVAVLTHDGAKQYNMKYYTPEEIKTWLLKVKKQRDEAIEKAKAQKAQQELDKKIQEQAEGRAFA